MNPSRTQLWLESLGDWAWPGRAAEALPSPPSWVPALPPRLEPAIAMPAGSMSRRARVTPRRVLLAGLLSALAGVSGALVLRDPHALEAVLGERTATPPPAVIASAAAPVTAPLLPTLVPLSADAAGSRIDRASFASAALGGEGSLLVYLPPNYASSTARYPVLYLLHGQNGHANAFLEVGLQQTLDKLIAKGAIQPMIAVMIQDASTWNNWRDMGRRRSASYVVEVQNLIDQMLPTIATRPARAIAGSSMGGFGAMHVALANPYRFSVVESWLGYFNNLDGELHADAPIIARLGLHAYLYGAVGDLAADPAEDPAFAGQLRAAGAQAAGVIYRGNHSLMTVHEHLEAMMLFAGRSLADAQARASAEEANARAAAGAAHVQARARTTAGT